MSVRACSIAFLTLLVGSLFLAFPRTAMAGPPTPVVYSFEGFSDSTAFTTPYAGLTFSNAVIATAGVSLNELEAPPRSGVNVVEDTVGPISIQFASPVNGFGGYFNYGVPLTLTAFNSGGQRLGSVSSLFSSDFKLSGDPGSHPNEFLQFFSASGISRVTLAGDPGGGSFTLDDATVTPFAPVPEASTLVSLGLPLLGLGVFLFRRRPAPRP